MSTEILLEPAATLFWRDQDNSLALLDQTRLPHQVEYIECHTAAETARAISSMQVRGAPAIGITAAYGMVLAAQEYLVENKGRAVKNGLLMHLLAAGQLLRATRPTAVNLAWAVERMQDFARTALEKPLELEALTSLLLQEARAIHTQDVANNRKMGAFGADLIPDGANVLTHCNAGSLATGGYGTQIGVIRSARDQGKSLHVWVDETRPYLQGSRLTVWELQQLGIPLTLITDNMAGHLMQRGKVQLVITGADRIAANGDVVNKIGTYTLAVLCQAHNIPLYVAAPFSTIDLSLPSGETIPIEERSVEEVTMLAGVQIAPAGTHAAHPAFDLTPARFVTAIVTERGVVYPPYDGKFEQLLKWKGKDNV